MKSYKRKEYVLFLILLYKKFAVCNPCINQTLNAIPYPNDCQAFILCWLSHAYLQTCPNGLYFDIKTNNCQPLMVTSCCNMTLPLLIIPINIFQGKNVTNTWPFTYVPDKQTNHTNTNPLLSTFKPNSTILTSANPSAATTSIISTLWTWMTNSSRSTQGFTLNVTEQTEIQTTTPWKLTSSDIKITDSTNLGELSQPNTHATPGIMSSTELNDNNKPNSTLLVSTKTPESTTPIIYNLLTELTGSSRSSSSSEITSDVTEIETTTPLATTSRYASETKITESSQPNVYTTPTSATATESRNKKPKSTLTISTNLPEASTLKISTWWTELTESETSNVTEQTEVETTTPLQTTSSGIYVTGSTISKESSKSNVYTHASSSFTDSAYNTLLVTKSTSNTNLLPLSTFSSTTLNPLNTESEWTDIFTSDTENHETVVSTEEQDKKTKTTVTVGTATSSQIFPTITMDPLRTKPQTITESTTLQPIFSSTASMPPTSDNSFSAMTSSTTELYWSSTIPQNSVNESSTESVSGFIEYTQPDPPAQTKLITEFIPSTATLSSQTEFKASTINYFTSSTEFSSEISSTITADPTTAKQIYTESSTFPPLFSSTINILSSTGSPLFPTITTTPEYAELSTITQYSVNETSTESVSSYTEYARTRVTTVGPTSSSDFAEAKEYSPITITPYPPTEFKRTTINFITSSTQISSEVPLKVTADPLQTKTQIFTKSSNLPSIFPSKTNMPYTSESSTSEAETSSTLTQTVSSPSHVARTKEYTTENNISTPVPSSTADLMSTTEYVLATLTSESLPSQFTSNTDYKTHHPKTTVVSTSPSEFAESTIYRTEETETYLVPLVTTVESSPIIFKENTTWQPVTFTLSSPSSNFISTINYITNEPITTVSSSSPSELNISENPEYISTMLSTFPSIFKEHSTTIESFPTHYITNTADKEQIDNSAATSISLLATGYTTIVPTTYTNYVTRNPVTTDKPNSSNASTINHSKYTSFKPVTTDATSNFTFTTLNHLTPITDGSTTSQVKPSSSVTEPEIIVTATEETLETELHTVRPTVPEGTTTSIKSNTSNFTSILSSTSLLTTEKPIVIASERTLPPLPYSPPPCVFATTTQKTTKGEKLLSTIPFKVTSSPPTYITPEPSTDSPVSKLECGIWDKFMFADQSDCKCYYECLFGDIRKNSCRYGYEFNPYALKCMPHLEANCQRPKPSNEVIDFLYNNINLNNPNEDREKEHLEMN